MFFLFDRRMIRARARIGQTFGRRRGRVDRPRAVRSTIGRMPRLTRIYTKTGDEGLTGLGGGRRVSKDAPRVRAYGTVDELNSTIGVALALGPDRAARHGARDHPERAVRPGLRPVLARGRRAPRPHPDRPAAARRAPRAAHRRAQRGRRTADELPAARRLTGRGPAPRRADDLPASRARGHHAAPRRADRGTGPPLPQPAVGRAVRDGPLREPRARRRRAALEAGAQPTTWALGHRARRVSTGPRARRPLEPGVTARQRSVRAGGPVDLARVVTGGRQGHRPVERERPVAMSPRSVTAGRGGARRRRGRPPRWRPGCRSSGRLARGA